jgi:rhamnosyltransferase
MAKSNPKISVIILTRNSAKTIKDVLDGVIKQRFDDFEVLLIDSESTDQTLSIAKQYPLKIISIKSSNFGHGKTRNYAAKLAKGDFIVFLTHDSVPEKNNWLDELIAPFADQNVVGVYGQQVPRNDENVLDKHFHMGLYGNKKIIWASDNWSQGDNLFSDANSALRRKFLLKYPYAPDIIVSEDYEWATRMLKLEFNIVYSPTARVIHSHSYTLHTLFKRSFDVGVSYKTIYEINDLHNFIRKGFEILSLEVRYLRESGNARHIPHAMIRDIVRFTAIQFGKREHLLSVKVKRNYLSGQRWYWK